MKFMCLKPDRKTGTIEFFKNPTIIGNSTTFPLPNQFTLEFWLKCKFDPNYVGDDLTLFDLWQYDSEEIEKKHPSNIPDGVMTTIEDGTYLIDENSEPIEKIIFTKEGITSYIGIKYHSGESSSENKYIFNIGTKRVEVFKHEIDNKWNHIALVWDDLNDTSCIFYLNGKVLLGSNMDSENMIEFKNKNFCRFIWTIYNGNIDSNKQTQHYVWLYNISFVETTKPTTPNTYEGIRFNGYFDPLSFAYTATNITKFKLNIDNDDCMCPIIIPEMAHSNILESEGIDQLIYLPFTNDFNEDQGSLQLKWNFYDQNKQAKITETKLINDYLWDYDYIYNLEYYADFSNGAILEADQPIDLSAYKNGITIDAFLKIQVDSDNNSIYPFSIIGHNKSKGSLIKYSYKTPSNVLESGTATIGTFNSNNKSLANTAFPDILRQHIRYSEASQVYDELLDTTATSKNLAESKHIRHMYHYALVMKPYDIANPNDSGYIYVFVNGNRINLGLKEFTLESANQLITITGNSSYFGLNHFRISDGCIWSDKSFDPTTDTRLFKLDPTNDDKNDPSIIRKDYVDADTNNKHIALYYPEVNADMNPYSRNYSNNLNIWGSSSLQKANFQVEPYSANINDIKLVNVSSLTSDSKPTSIQGKPAVVTNTYKDCRNIIKFRNHSITNESWTISLWIYLEKQIEGTNYSFDLFYASGFGYDGDVYDQLVPTNTNSYYGKGNGFIGIIASTKGAVSICTNTLANQQTNQFPWSTSDYVMYKYGKYIIRRNEFSFKLNDWNHIGISSDINSKNLYIYLNGDKIYTETSRKFSKLHRLFLYTGEIDMPVKPYFAGLRVIMDKVRYNAEKITNYINE